MNEENLNQSGERLGALLRESRLSPSLPPRFQDAVWRRIGEADAPARTMGSETWLDALVSLVLRPRFAFAAATLLVLAGALLGSYNGSQIARQDAQARYLAAVAPNPLR